MPIQYTVQHSALENFKFTVLYVKSIEAPHLNVSDLTQGLRDQLSANSIDFVQIYCDSENTAQILASNPEFIAVFKNTLVTSLEISYCPSGSGPYKEITLPQQLQEIIKQNKSHPADVVAVSEQQSLQP